MKQLTFYGSLFALATIVGCSGSMATAQTQNCAEHEVVTERLATHYGEHRVAVALGGDNSVLEVFTSVETGTWTIAVTRAGGLTCLVAAGDNFELTLDYDLEPEGEVH